jgi:hemerythrin superfamily protein
MPSRTDASTKGERTGDAANRGTGGLVGVFQTLANQHDQVAAMFEQLEGQPESRALLWPQLRRELVSHEHSEVRELYPVLRQFEETRKLADHHDEEARDLDALIARLDSANIQSEQWGELFEQLVAIVIHHAKDEEEATIFPAAQKAIGEARAIELDAKVAAAKQQFMQEH